MALNRIVHVVRASMFEVLDTQWDDGVEPSERFGAVDWEKIDNHTNEELCSIAGHYFDDHGICLLCEISKEEMET